MYRPLNLSYLPLLFITFCLYFIIKCYVDLTFLDIESKEKKTRHELFRQVFLIGFYFISHFE